MFFSCKQPFPNGKKKDVFFALVMLKKHKSGHKVVKLISLITQVARFGTAKVLPKFHFATFSQKKCKKNAKEMQKRCKRDAKEIAVTRR